MNRQGNQATRPHRDRLLVLAGTAILALFAAQGEASSWNIYLKALLRRAIWTEGAALGTRQAASMFSRCLCWKK
jgi:hypothetical protein